MRDAQLTLVDSWEEAQQFIEWMGKRRDALAIDTETTGLKWWTPSFVRLIQFGDTEAGWAVPVHKWLGLVENALGNYTGPVIMHNAQFDLHALDSLRLPLPGRERLHDTKVLHHLVEPLSAHGLKRIATQKWGSGAAVGEKELKRAFAKNKWFWDTVPYDFQPYWAYAAMDTVLTARLFADLQTGTSSVAYQREMDVSRIMFGAEKRGMRIDDTYTSALAAEWLGEMLSIQEELDKWGMKNANSRIQLLAALQAEIAFEPGEFTETGEPKLSEGILADLPGEVAPAVLRYRRLRKWSSAYLQHFLHEQDSLGRVHPSINTTAARTGRMSITGPPMQTLPRGSTIRKCIIPSDGGRILAVDYDTKELRVFAGFAQEAALMAAFADGRDLHRFAASLVYGVAEKDVTPRQRQITKNTQYGLAYCAGVDKLCKTSGASRGEVEHFLDIYHGYFPAIKDFVQAVIRLGEQRVLECGHGFVKTTGGREVWCLPGEEYKLVNGLIQGSCADVFKEALVNLDNAGYGESIIVPVHDEILFDIPVAEFEGARREISLLMTYDKFPVELTVHASGPMLDWGGEEG